MPRKKLKHIQACFTLPNVFTTATYTYPTNTITLEIGCGHGAYTLALAARYPEQQFLGIDRKPDRIWVGATAAIERNLPNAGFIVSDIGKLSEFFPDHSISSIWLPFPDPQPRTKYAEHRLIALKYLLLYQQLLIPHGIVHLKTDNLDLITEAKTNIALLHGTVHQENHNYNDEIYTTYEQKYRALGKPIYYLEFSL